LSAACPSYFVSAASTAATYIFTAPTCTAPIIPLEPCALNTEFQHFILCFNKIFLSLLEPCAINAEFQHFILCFFNKKFLILLEPCALNAEFQHSILCFLIKKFLILLIPLKEGLGCERRPKDRVKTR
jgi:hypothetical protein